MRPGGSRNDSTTILEKPGGCFDIKSDQRFKCGRPVSAGRKTPVASALRCYLLIRGSHPIASPWQVVRRNPLRKEWLWYFRVTRTAWFPGGSQRGWEQAPRTPRG